MEGTGSCVHECLGDGVGIDPTNLRMLAGFAVFGFAGPLVGGEDDGEEAVESFNAPGAVDEVGDLQGFRLHGQAGLLVQLANCGFGDGLAGFVLADGEVPRAAARPVLARPCSAGVSVRVLVDPAQVADVEAADMFVKYKETARGGLAVNIIEC